MLFHIAAALPSGIVTDAPLRIYTGILGQIGDIVMFTATVRRLKELFPRSTITFAVSAKYREAGELVAGLPYVDRLFVTRLYFEKLSQDLFLPWELGWPVDFRGDDEVAEQRAHDLVLETRPRHRRHPWWEHAHQVEECAHMVGVPGPMDRRTEIAIPPGTGDGVRGGSGGRARARGARARRGGWLDAGFISAAAPTTLPLLAAGRSPDVLLTSSPRYRRRGGGGWCCTTIRTSTR